MPRTKLTLRHARARQRPNPPRRAHTASGREIAGFWGWMERVVLLVTLLSVGFGYQVYQEERDTRRQEAINRAWSLITTPATGNSGKGPALEYLNDQGIPLQGINLSCEHMGGGWDAEKLTCETPTYLRGVELHGADLEGAQLQGADLTYADLQRAYLGFVGLQGADLRGAKLQGANLAHVYLQRATLTYVLLRRIDLTYADLQDADLVVADFQEAHLTYANLRNAVLAGADLQGADLHDAKFEGANLSGADFTDAKQLDTALLRDPETGLSAWAWADRPPIGLDGIEIDLCVFDPQIHSGLERPDPCIPPDAPAAPE